MKIPVKFRVESALSSLRSDDKSFRLALGAGQRFTMETGEEAVSAPAPSVHGGSFKLFFGSVSRVQAGSDDYPLYQGAYTVTPKDEAQTLPTKNTAMADDVTVKEIPYYEVSNQTGSTVYIGKELS